MRQPISFALTAWRPVRLRITYLIFRSLRSISFLNGSTVTRGSCISTSFASVPNFERADGVEPIAD